MHWRGQNHRGAAYSRVVEEDEALRLHDDAVVPRTQNHVAEGEHVQGVEVAVDGEGLEGLVGESREVEILGEGHVDVDLAVRRVREVHVHRQLHAPDIALEAAPGHIVRKLASWTGRPAHNHIQPVPRVAPGAGRRVGSADQAAYVAALAGVHSVICRVAVVVVPTQAQAVSTQQIGLVSASKGANGAGGAGGGALNTVGRAVGAVGHVVDEGAYRARVVAGIAVPGITESGVALVTVGGRGAAANAGGVTRIAGSVGVVGVHADRTGSQAGVVRTQVERTTLAHSAVCAQLVAHKTAHIAQDANQAVIHHAVASETALVAGGG